MAIVLKNEIIRFSLKKSAEILLTLAFVTMLSFVLMRVTPIDAATAYVQRNTKLITEEQIREVRRELGLDKPLVVQYRDWAVGILQGDFGNSLYDGRPVAEKLGESLPTTLSIVGLSAVVMVIGIILLGVLAYLFRRNFIGSMILILCVFGTSIPPFCTAIGYLDIFAVKLGLMSVQGNEGVWKYFPAAFCLSVLGICLYSQMLAKGIEHQMNEDWAMYSRCRGISEKRILWCHALPNAAVEILPSFMQVLGLFMAGSSVVEIVFSLPGLGNEIVHSVVHRDSPMLHAEMLVMAAAFVTCSLISDILQLILDKRKMGIQ